MKVLAFDTCLGAVSVAAGWRGADDEWLLHEACEPRNAKYAERLFPMISEVVQSAGMTLKTVDRIAVTLGPGSFSGVRVGIAAARAFALALRKPVVGSTSLAVIAHGAEAVLGRECNERQLAVAVEGPRSMLYFQIFGDKPSEARLVAPVEAARALGQNPTLIVGSGAVAVAAVGSGQVEVQLADLQPRARSLAEMAPGLPELDTIEPLYLRQPDARPQGKTFRTPL